MLLVYLVVTAAVLGFVLTSPLGRLVVFLLLGLFTISFLLIIDIDRPTSGGILESQSPMEQLRAALKSQPISVYDRWREPQVQR
ncbi:MAG TPA: hypothetical protein VFI23_11035 [Rhizomicrobium sp.]|nr:hypothetical protein [Rhizomicrobium sp.]